MMIFLDLISTVLMDLVSQYFTAKGNVALFTSLTSVDTQSVTNYCPGSGLRDCIGEVYDTELTMPSGGLKPSKTSSRKAVFSPSALQ